MTQNETNKGILTTPEALALILGVSAQSVKLWVKQGKLSSVIIGKRSMVYRVEKKPTRKTDIRTLNKMVAA